MLLTACPVPTLVGVQSTSEGDTSLDSETTALDDLPALDVALGDCDPPAPASCDASSDDPLQVVGLDCVDGTPAAGGVTAEASAVATHAGPLGPYDVREGEKFLILSTGVAGHLPLSLDELEAVCAPSDWPDLCPSTGHQLNMRSLPAPIDVNPVDGELTCIDDPGLIGAGDCSNSLFPQWNACGGGCEVWDYAELRIKLTVPEHTLGLAFDFAFLSVEWPDFVDGSFNDMFVAWLESERWTGNVSFDGAGNPITVNAGFTDYTGDELDGFAMEGHAGTRWLTTDFGVAPGETLQLVLAVFDLDDDDYDSVVLLDGFRWTCTGTPPTTEPVP